jgi:tRNA pseudouridine38-40 synthase
MEKKRGIKKQPLKIPRAAETEMKSFRLVVAYVGTAYQGWQKQAREDGPPTVQEMLEKAACKVLKLKRVIIHGSGRTDSGVHARAQVAHLRAPVDLPANVLIRALNAHLPDDIRILQLEPCAIDFHSQLDAKVKTYRYFILNTISGKDAVHWPFLRAFTWFVTYPLNLEAMKTALKEFEGEHDFKSFQNTGTPLKSTVRKVHEAKLIVHGGKSGEIPPWMPGPETGAQLLEIRISGSGFLKQMVRNIAGTVVEVGRGRIPADKLGSILKEKNRKAGGMTAPAYGLFLDQVSY